MAAIRNPPLVAISLVLTLLGAGCSGSQPLQLPLTSAANIQLPRDVGHLPAIDLTTLDPRTHRLYVPHGSNSALDVVDLVHRRVIGSVPGLVGIKAVALSPDPGIVFTSDAGNVAVVDANALKIVARIPIAGAGDAIAYDPVDRLIGVSLGDAGKLLLIDAVSRQVVATMGMPGKLELIGVDPQTGKLYVAINDRDEVAVVDLVARVIDPIYRGCDIKAPTGLALDAQQGRLFVADTTGRNLVSVVDVVIDRCLGAIDIGHGTDELAFNSHRHHLYAASAGSQNLSVIDTVSLKPLGIVGTGPSAGNVAADPGTDQVYVVIPRSGIVAVFHDP
jgi:DNA-binding beta-propeller fold protein YncE